jgi:hypothetical protein
MKPLMFLLTMMIATRLADAQSLFSPASFQPVAPPAASPWLTSCVVADFNGDGFPDALFGEDFSVGQVKVHLVPGTGQASFGATIQISIGPTLFLAGGYVFPLGVIDANLDGLPDVVALRETAGGGGPSVLLNAGNNTFTQMPWSSTSPFFTYIQHTSVTDLDNDGGVDYIVTGVVASQTFVKVFTTFAGQVFSEVYSLQPTQGVHALTVADVNGDGLNDIVYERFTPSPYLFDLMVLLRTTGSGFTLLGPFPWPPVPGVLNQTFRTDELVVADVNGDGFMDVTGFGDATIMPSNAVILTVLGTASGALVPGPVHTTTLPENGLGSLARGRSVLADHDLDGQLDLRTLSRVTRLAPAYGGTNTMVLDNSGSPIGSNGPVPVFMEFSVDGDLDGDLDVIQVLHGSVPPTFLAQTFVGVAINRTIDRKSCYGSFPIAATVGTPAPGNPALTVGLTMAPPNAAAALGLSHAAGFLPLGPCAIGLDLGQLILPTPLLGFTNTDATGAASFAFNVPNDPALIGTDYFLQWLVADPTGPIPAVWTTYSLSEARRVVFW